MKTKVLSIREYVHQLDWDNICKIHDSARLIELEGSVTKKAFVPLINCYKDEEFFKSTIFIGEVENRTIGFVAFDKHEITWLYVDPKFFGNGYGRRLLDFVIDKALKPIKVTVLNNNLRAISLYKSCGFKVMSESKGKIPLTDFEATGLKMEKDDEIV
jgi:ribosomal protein S18 acetylase RimI-like enzyme